MSVVSEIFNGYKNYFIKEEEVEELAFRRSEICSQCEYKKKGVHAAILPDITLGQVQGYYCAACAGCPLSVKVRSENHKCPKGKW